MAKQSRRDVMTLLGAAGAGLPLGVLKGAFQETRHILNVYEISPHTMRLLKLIATWNDAARTVTISFAAGARAMLPVAGKPVVVQVAGTSIAKPVTFTGRTVSVKLEA